MIVETWSAPGRSLETRVVGYLRVYQAVHSGPPTIQAIAAGLGVSAHAVGGALARLEQSGHIRTQIHVAQAQARLGGVQ